MITIVAAMERELAPLRKVIGAISPQSPPLVPISFQVLGIGRERTVAAIEALLKNAPRPELVLMVGFAAALRKELKAGDLVIAQRFHAIGETQSIHSSPIYCTLAQKTAEEDELAYITADSLTVPHLISSPKEKQELGRGIEVWAANMEDYWVASSVTESGVPFLSVRAVLDTADQTLSPKIAALGWKSSTPQLLAATILAITRPWMLAPMMRLRWQAKLAGQALSSFTASFFPKAMAEQISSPV